MCVVRTLKNEQCQMILISICTVFSSDKWMVGNPKKNLKTVKFLITPLIIIIVPFKL